MELNYLNFNGALKGNCKRRKSDKLLYVSATIGTLTPNFKLGFFSFPCLLQLNLLGRGENKQIQNGVCDL